LQEAERWGHAEQWQQAAMVYRTAIALAGDSLCSIEWEEALLRYEAELEWLLLVGQIRYDAGSASELLR
jgi:hypothetical protein